MAENEFDADYVKKLREEAAGWRTKYRELEVQGVYKDVQLELVNQGIKADPTWVELKEGQSVTDAIKDLVSKHPHLAETSVTPTLTPTELPEVKKVQPPHVMRVTEPKTEVPSNPLHERSVEEIKKDPVARSRLRDLYRAKLLAASNQPEHQY